MTLDIKQVEAVFKVCHEEKEFEELRQEKQDNYSILYSQPFDEKRDRDQISKLIDKYGAEINALAKRKGNGKTTTKQPIDKTPQDMHPKTQQSAAAFDFAAALCLSHIYLASMLTIQWDSSAEVGYFPEVGFPLVDDLVASRFNNGHDVPKDSVGYFILPARQQAFPS